MTIDAKVLQTWYESMQTRFGRLMGMSGDAANAITKIIGSSVLLVFFQTNLAAAGKSSKRGKRAVITFDEAKLDEICCGNECTICFGVSKEARDSESIKRLSG